MTMTKEKPMTTADFMQPPPALVDVTAHQADLARRQKERNERCSIDERLKLCNGSYAKKVELAKPRYRFEVSCNLIKPTEHDKDADPFADEDEEMGDFLVETKKGVVIAQDENEAWSMFCDKLKRWPSRRHSHATFKNLGVVV